MRGGIVLIVIGLSLGFLAVSGKICCLTQAFDCAMSDAENPCQCAEKSKDAQSAPQSLQDQLKDLLKPLDVPGFDIFPYTF